MPSNINAEDFGRVVEVEYDYSYKANDGRTVAIKQGQKYVLIKKSNEDWWQVIDKSKSVVNLRHTVVLVGLIKV